MAKRHGKSVSGTRDDFRAFQGCLISLTLGAAIWIAAGIALWALLQAIPE